MAFISKEDLISQKYMSAMLPYPDVRDTYIGTIEHIKQVHEDELSRHFKTIANMLCSRYSNRQPGDKNPVFGFDPCAFHYFHYGNQKFLSSHLKDIVGSSQEALLYYTKRYQDAFPDFTIDIKPRSDVYTYAVTFDIQ
jgi:hypothetical protein